jgi:mannonate dehydratase
MPMTTHTPPDIDRRQFFSATGAGLGALAASQPNSLGADDTPAPPRSKTKIRIGARISPAWLASPNDNDLRFLKQIGVDYVDITLDKIKGYRETGRFTREALKEFVDRLTNVGLRIERANSLAPYYLNAHLGRAEGDREIDNLKKIAELLAAAEVPVFGIQACQASLHVKDDARAGWSRRQGRGGYDYPFFDQGDSEKAPKPAYKATAEQLWKGLLNIYRQVVPVIEGSKTRVAMHGNDPPLAQYLGNPQIICRFADFDRLFREVPSKHSGITFCVGTRYESGEDVFEGIRRFGKQGKLFHVHFRNVRGTLPARKSYGEVFVDDGDLDMARVVRALHEVGYDGVIDYDHPIGITGDQPLPKQYIAFAVGYMRGLLHGLPS